MEKMYTTIQAAQIIGCHQSTVSRWAKALGFTRKYGNYVALTLEQVNIIADKWKHQSGNPNFKKKAS